VDTEQLRGKVIVVKVFAKYCAPCVRTLPATQALYESVAPRVAFVGIAVDEVREDVQSMIDRYGLTFPIVHDRKGVLAARFRASALPATFVVTAEGVVHWVGGGDMTEDALRRAIASAK